MEKYPDRKKNVLGFVWWTVGGTNGNDRVGMRVMSSVVTKE